MLRMGILCVALLLPAALLGQDGREADELAIHGVMDGFMDAWNHHDAKAWTALFSEDADFTNVRGVGATGRSKIEEFHAPVFATIFRSSRLAYTDVKIRFVSTNVAAVDVRWAMTGVLDAQGSPRPDREGLLNFVMTKHTGRWQILVMHNLDLTALPSPSK